MAYLSQIILFALAVVGTWFRTFKEDDKGKSVHSRLGFRIPTKAGVIILTLSLVSFLFSMYSTWNDREDKEKQKKEMERYQEEMRRETQAGIARVLNPLPKDLRISPGMLLFGDQAPVRDYIERLMSDESQGGWFRRLINSHPDGTRLGLSTNLYPNPAVSPSEKALRVRFKTSAEESSSRLARSQGQGKLDALHPAAHT